MYRLYSNPQGKWGVKVPKVLILLILSFEKLNFDQKVIESEEANSSLSLEEAIVRWVGLDEIKQKFNASDIMLVQYH